MRSTFRRFLFNTTLAGTFLLSGAAFAQEEAAAEPVAEEAVPEVEEEAAPAAAEAPAEEAAPAAEEPKKETSIAADETVYAEMSLEDLLGVAVEISSTKAQTIFSTPSTVSVIDRSAIQSFGFTSVADAVERVAGVSVLRTYLKRNIPTIRGVLQTHYANKVLVLIDGVPAWHAVTGEGSLDRVGIDMVERIEVLRGPASVLYGTNAYSGAINIVTRRATKTGGSLDFSAGDKRSTSAAASYSYIDGDLKFFVGASGNDEQGDSYLYKDYQDVEGRVFEYLKGNNLTLRTQYKAHTLVANAYTFHESHFGVVPKFSSGAGNDHWMNGYLTNYTFSDEVMDKLKVTAGATYDLQHRNLSRSADDVVRANVKGYRAAAFAKAGYDAMDWLNIELGAAGEYRNSLRYANMDEMEQIVTTGTSKETGETLQNENDMRDQKVFETTAFLQANMDFSPMTLVLGARYTNDALMPNEDYVDVDALEADGVDLVVSNLSFRGTAVYELNKTSSVKLVAGQSFRAPTLFELYFKTASATVNGNPALKPETATSVELAYLASFDNLFVQALGYWAQYENTIYRASMPADSTWTTPAAYSLYKNGDTITAMGAELEMRYRIPRAVDVFMNYYFVSGDSGDEVFTEDATTGDLVGNDHYNFKYIPQHTLSMGASKTMGIFFGSALVNYVHEREGRNEMIDAQYTIDLNLGFNFAGLRHTLAAHNLLDETVMVPEYVRADLNAYPNSVGRRIFYRIQADF